MGNLGLQSYSFAHNLSYSHLSGSGCTKVPNTDPILIWIYNTDSTRFLWLGMHRILLVSDYSVNWKAGKSEMRLVVSLRTSVAELEKIFGLPVGEDSRSFPFF